MKRQIQARRAQRGASLLIVLIVLTVLLLGGLSMARLDADAALIAGNTAYRDAALQASEVGLADAYAQVQGLADEETDQSGYFASRQVQDAAGLPQVDWSNKDKLPVTAVGPYSVQHVVERLCTGTMPVTNASQQCVMSQAASDLMSSSKAGADSFDAPVGKQYRVTVSVTGPKNTQVFVQDAVIR